MTQATSASGATLKPAAALGQRPIGTWQTPLPFLAVEHSCAPLDADKAISLRTGRMRL